MRLSHDVTPGLQCTPIASVAEAVLRRFSHSLESRKRGGRSSRNTIRPSMTSLQRARFGASWHKVRLTMSPSS